MQEHNVCGYAYTVVRCDDQAQPPKVYRGRDAILEEGETINEIFRNPNTISMTMDDANNYEKSKKDLDLLKTIFWRRQE